MEGRREKEGIRKERQREGVLLGRGWEGVGDGEGAGAMAPAQGGGGAIQAGNARCRGQRQEAREGPGRTPERAGGRVLLGNGVWQELEMMERGETGEAGRAQRSSCAQ